MPGTCDVWTRKSSLGSNATKIEYYKDCTKRIFCKSGKTNLWKSNEDIDADWCEPTPKPVDCSPSTAGEYFCDKTIASAYDLGNPVAKDTWTTCRDYCVADAKCLGWTFNPNKQCQKKKLAEYSDKTKYISGPRATPTPKPTSTPTPTPTSTPTTAPAAQTGWLKQKNSLGVENWVVVAVLVVLVMVCGCGGLMMLAMAGGGS